MVEKLIIGCVCLFSAIFFAIATTIPPPFVQTPLDSAFWPKLILTVLFFASAIQLVKLFRQPKEVEENLTREAEESRKEEEESTGEREELSLLIFGAIFCFIYIFSLRWIGFTVATPAFMMVFIYVTGYKNKYMMVVVSLCTVAFILFVFVRLTFIPLPRGYGIFRSISYLIY
jgi:hypothetical protein